jgi:hypothetical protein
VNPPTRGGRRGIRGGPGPATLGVGVDEPPGPSRGQGGDSPRVTVAGGHHGMISGVLGVPRPSRVHSHRWLGGVHVLGSAPGRHVPRGGCPGWGAVAHSMGGAVPKALGARGRGCGGSGERAVPSRSSRRRGGGGCGEAVIRVRGGGAGAALCAPHAPENPGRGGAGMWPGFYPPSIKPAQAKSGGDCEPAGCSVGAGGEVGCRRRRRQPKPGSR